MYNRKKHQGQYRFWLTVQSLAECAVIHPIVANTLWRHCSFDPDGGFHRFCRKVVTDIILINYDNLKQKANKSITHLWKNMFLPPEEEEQYIVNFVECIFKCWWSRAQPQSNVDWVNSYKTPNSTMAKR